MDTKTIHDLATSVAPAARTATITGTAVDLANFSDATFELIVGTVTDGTHTPSVTECDTIGGTYTAVAAADLIGSFAVLASNVNQRVGYRGMKRFVKQVITVTGGPATGAVAAGVVMRSGARRQPL